MTTNKTTNLLRPGHALSRRHMLGLMGGLGAAAALGMPSVVRAQEKKLRIAVYGGYFKDTFDAAIFPEFTKATGIAVESVAEPEGDAWLMQLQQAQKAGQAPVDISMMAQVPILRGMPARLWAPLDLKRMPGVEKITTGLTRQDEIGQTLAVPATAWYITLVSNTEVFPEAPTSWKELWDPKHADELGLFATPGTSCLVEITARTFFEGKDQLSTQEGVLEVIGKIAELKPNARLWYRDEAQFEQALKSGEVPMGQYYHDVTGLAIRDGFPVRSTMPEEGGVFDYGSWVVSQAAADKVDLAEVFIDFMVQPSTQSLLARTLGSAPVLERSLLDLTDEEFNAVSSDKTPILPNYELQNYWDEWLNQVWGEMLQS